MAIRTTSVTIVDKKESLPMRVNHATRKWEIFNPAKNIYEDTGLSAVPEDDATSIKYYKLSNTPTPPSAIGDSQTSWSDLASLNEAVITNGGWSADPLQVSKNNRFCWSAYYSLENLLDPVTKKYKQRYKLNMVGLYNNYAVSPTISIDDDGVVTITNSDGTTQTHQLMTANSYQSLMKMVTGLQSQVDSAVYSYSGAGVPTKNHQKAPLNSWGIKPNSPNNVVADIYAVHVGDTYTNTEDYVSYRFVLKEGMASSDPLSYEWQIIADGALSSALQEIAKLGNSTVKIFTNQPTPPYKKGDMWISTQAGKSVIKTCLLGKDENGTFAHTDWIVPFATKEEVATIRQDLSQAKSDLNLAKNNISDLQDGLNTLENQTLQAMRDDLIDDNERTALKVLSDNLDVEQEQLLSNVSYLKDSEYLPATEKSTLINASNKLLAKNTGTLDILQSKIADILNPTGDQGARISTSEKNAYKNALVIYKADHKALSQAIDTARAKIDEELKRLSDKNISELEIGGRNLLKSSQLLTSSSVSSYITDEFYKGCKVVHGDNQNKTLIDITYFNHVINLQSNEFYTLSFWAKGTECKCYIWSPNRIKKSVNSCGNVHYTGDGSTTFTLTNEWKRYWVVWETKSNIPVDTEKSCLIVGRLFKGHHCSICGIKLERGKIATDWTPAPEDVQSEMNTLISNVDVEYGVSNSPTEAPTSWQTTAPQWEKGKFVWQRIKRTLKDKTVNYSGATCIQGAEGKGIKNIEEQYYQSDSGVSLEGGNWSTEAPTINPSKYIWTRSVITYTDNTTTETAPICSTGAKGEDALTFTISTQGHFRNYYEQDEDGETELKKEVVGGVMVEGVECVECELIIRKGSRDVTDNALNDNTLALKWLVNGNVRQNGGKKLRLTLADCDGNDDNIQIRYNDKNAKNW